MLLDEIFANKESAADEMERLTFQLSCAFGRATKAVSVCAPAYLADVVCTRGRAHNPNLGMATDGSSVSSKPPKGGKKKGKGPAPSPSFVMNEQPRVHKRLRDTMYYM